jgi:hypothetical protein
MVYARAYDATVEADYYAAMGRIEQRLELVEKNEPAESVSENERRQLLTLAEQLFTPELTVETRLEIAVQMRGLLNGHQTAQVDWIPPPLATISIDAVAI